MLVGLSDTCQRLQEGPANCWLDTQTLAKDCMKDLQIVGWPLIEDQLWKINLETSEVPQFVKINSKFDDQYSEQLEVLLYEFKDVFAWTYKDLKGIPPELV